MKKKKYFAVLIAVLLLCSSVLTACSTKKELSEVTDFSQLNELNPTIAYVEDLSVTDDLMALCPNATLVPVSDISSAIVNLKNGTWTALVESETLIEDAVSKTEGLRVFEESVCSFDVALGISESTEIPDFLSRVNDAIASLQQDGTLDKMKTNWLDSSGEKVMPEIQLNAKSEYTIHCGTFGAVAPFTYYQGTELVGFDIELAYRVAQILDCNLVFETASFPSLTMGLATGKYDMIASDLFVDEERKENMLFSTPYSQESVCLMVYDPSSSSDSTSLEYNSLSELSSCASVGIVTGSIYEPVAKDLCPDAEISYYETLADCQYALSNGKVDAVIFDYAMLQYSASVDSTVSLIPEKYSEENNFFIAPKTEQGTALVKEFNTWLAEKRSDGTLEEMADFWLSNETAKTLDYDSLEATKGTLDIVCYASSRPDCYIYNGSITGYSPELIYQFCKDNGYGLNLVDNSLDGMLMGISTGKYDMAICFLSYTEERAAKVTYTDPVFSGGIAVMVRCQDASRQKSGFWQSVADGFTKTFVTENRWILILNGIGTTLLITVFGFLLANLLGALFCSFSLSKNKVLHVLAGIYSYIMQGTPTVVILMILYYIVFGSSKISGTIVAILGFGLVSGSSLARQFQGGIASVDKGQKEASLALGFTKPQTFSGIVFPQAARTTLPGYFAELIAMLKGTSIVGYIAVQDLTKMGDLIRNATYEAFFPLFSVALIYFAFSALLLCLLKLIQKRLTKRVRKPKEAKQ